MTISKRVLPNGILEKIEKVEKIFNSKRQLEKAFTQGEYYLAKYLDENLPDEWMIHTKPELRNRWGSFIRPTTPDIVIASKYKGIMIIEVKDWKIEKKIYKKVSTRNHRGREICKIFIKRYAIDFNFSCSTLNPYSCYGVFSSSSCISSFFNIKITWIINFFIIHNYIIFFLLRDVRAITSGFCAS